MDNDDRDLTPTEILKLASMSIAASYAVLNKHGLLGESLICPDTDPHDCDVPKVAYRELLMDVGLALNDLIEASERVQKMVDGIVSSTLGERLKTEPIH